jgi:hypothetical protein
MQAFMSPSTTKAERRRKSRKRPPSLVYVELPSANGGMMRDLSEEGFAVRAMMPLRAGKKTPFSFSLNESIRIEGEGEILWIEENGRVAGVRFTQISSEALEQIHDWLSGSQDSSKRHEIPGKSAVPPAATLDQLREEIRSGPLREEPPEAIPAMPPLPVPETVPAAPEVIPSAPPPENAPSGLHASASGGTSVAPAPEILSNSTSIPVLPPLPQTPNAVESSVEPLPSTSASVNDALISVEPPKPFPRSVISDSDAVPTLTDPALPDISEILIQPSGKQTGYSPNSSTLEPLASWEQVSVRPRASWTDRFTLSSAVTIMVLLALVVAISAYHREVGQALIWLGEQMGGTQARQSQLPASDNTASTRTPGGSSSNRLDSQSQESTSAQRTTENHKKTTAGTALGHDSHASLSSVAKNALPPVTPLSGISASSSDTGQETGQTEYLQALQLLRGKNPGADRSEIVRLLWISVEKGNPSAEVALADMYWRGQGVARNCNQTRILLTAAARKGSAEAQKRLQQFQREGCE